MSELGDEIRRRLAKDERIRKFVGDEDYERYAGMTSEQIDAITEERRNAALEGIRRTEAEGIITRILTPLIFAECVGEGLMAIASHTKFDYMRDSAVFDYMRDSAVEMLVEFDKLYGQFKLLAVSSLPKEPGKKFTYRVSALMAGPMVIGQAEFPFEVNFKDRGVNITDQDAISKMLDALVKEVTED